jgi:hypothetical protein
VGTDSALRLRAEDTDDLAVISACVQDALVSVRDLTYDRSAQTFTLVVNRFRWEGRSGELNGTPPFERTHAVLTIIGVKSVSYRGFRRSDEDRILALLAIRAAADGSGTIDLEFAGGVAVRIGVGGIHVRVTDIGEPWPTAWQPDHAAGDPA